MRMAILARRAPLYPILSTVVAPERSRALRVPTDAGSHPVVMVSGSHGAACAVSGKREAMLQCVRGVAGGGQCGTLGEELEAFSCS